MSGGPGHRFRVIFSKVSNAAATVIKNEGNVFTF